MAKTVVLTTKSIHIQRERAQMPRVMVESPLGGDYWKNVEYARMAMRHSMMMVGESPMALHLLYNKSLRDGNDVERSIGIKRSFDWHSHAEKKAFYIDRGLSNGMIMGYLDACAKGQQTEFRFIAGSKETDEILGRANKKTLTLPQLEKLSTELKVIICNNAATKGIPTGAVTDYQERYTALVNLIDKLNVNVDNEESLFNCLAMRESLMRRNESPLIVEELYSQFLDINDKEKAFYLDASQSWLQVVDEIIPFVNPHAELDEGLMDLDKRSYDQSVIDELPIIEEVLSHGYSSAARQLNDNIEMSQPSFAM
ncbi:hypothetical protein [Psychromonas sp. SP041]|uniref:DUF7768 domain-containing protein n=1 Tax=Psychromonas sp. SP041 TaxID=1365007 RepID=UPI000685BFAA|nr:hypothetical protein [Psychromonas sp. SP041]